MTEKTVLQQISNLVFDIQNTDDLQVIFDKADEILELTTQNHQPTFEVGEYYSFTTYRKDNDADTTFIFKTLETKNSGIRVIEYDCHGKNYEEYVYDIDSDFLNDSMPATAEQIATFRRAEHFASKGRKLDEFHAGDRVNCSELPFDNGYYTGDVVINGLGKKTFVAQLENGLHLYNSDDLNKVTLIQTAEELWEVADE